MLRIARDLLMMIYGKELTDKDLQHVEMLKDYEQMIAKNEKKDYILAKLSEKYSISVSTIKRSLRRLHI